MFEQFLATSQQRHSCALCEQTLDATALESLSAKVGTCDVCNRRRRRRRRHRQHHHSCYGCC